MCVQLAFFRTYHSLCATYESAQTRAFLKGRTETIRPAGPATRSFVESFGTASPGLLPQILRKAIQEHADFAKKAVTGKGIDRLFLGLQLAMAENELELPKLFTNELFQRCFHFRLSTSQVPSPDGCGM